MKSEKILLPNGSGEMTLPQINAELQEAAEPDGPRFEEVAEKIDSAHTGGWGEKLQSLLVPVKKFAGSKKYTVAALSIAILLAGGFVVTSLGQQQTENLNVAVSETGTSVQPEEATSRTTAAQQNDAAGTSFLTQEAQAGEGVTHLARRTVRAYAATQGTQLSAEQLVYAEDALRKSVETQSLSTGQQVQFSQEDIEAAYQAALQLEPWQLENLEQYAQRVH